LFSAEFYSIFYIKVTIKALVSGRNTMPGRPRRLSENRMSGQEMEVEAMEEGEINDEDGE
jgi:hypothetical protein